MQPAAKGISQSLLAICIEYSSPVLMVKSALHLSGRTGKKLSKGMPLHQGYRNSTIILALPNKWVTINHINATIQTLLPVKNKCKENTNQQESSAQDRSRLPQADPNSENHFSCFSISVWETLR